MAAREASVVGTEAAVTVVVSWVEEDVLGASRAVWVDQAVEQQGERTEVLMGEVVSVEERVEGRVQACLRHSCKLAFQPDALICCGALLADRAALANRPHTLR